MFAGEKRLSDSQEKALQMVKSNKRFNQVDHFLRGMKLTSINYTTELDPETDLFYYVPAPETDP